MNNLKGLKHVKSFSYPAGLFENLNQQGKINKLVQMINNENILILKDDILDFNFGSVLVIAKIYRELN